MSPNNDAVQCYILLVLTLHSEYSSEHKNLRRPGHNPQIIHETDSEGFPCLIYREDAKSKTNQGGLSSAYKEPRVMYCYESDNLERCAVRLNRKYFGLLPKTSKHKELYMQAKRKPFPQSVVHRYWIGHRYGM